jgi:HEAT repeat protein
MGAEANDTLAERMLALNQKLLCEYLKGLANVSPTVRAKSARGLKALGSLAAQAVPALENHRSDPDRRVREAVASALEAIRSCSETRASG